MCSVRAADRADYEVFARLFGELQVPDPLLTSTEFAEQMLPCVAIAQEGATGVGYAYWRRYGEAAHLVQLVVDPGARGRGHAGALFEDVRERARAAGCVRWFLNVKQDNAAAIRVYQRGGMTVEQEGWMLDTTWTALGALSGQPSPACEPALVPPSADEVIATHFGIDAARLAQLRTKPGEVFYACYANGAPVAFAGFDPSLPGIYPIRAQRTDLLPALLGALRGHALHEHVHMAVEGNRALYEALHAAGGQLRAATFRMGARL